MTNPKLGKVELTRRSRFAWGDADLSGVKVTHRPNEESDSMKSTKSVYNREYLALAHEKRREQGEETRNTIKMIVKESDQPITTAEVARIHELTSGRRLNYTYISMILNDAVAAGELSSRQETVLECDLRVGAGARSASRLSKLYWRSAKTVPTRTRGKIVDGVESSTALTYQKNSKYSKKAKRAAKKNAGVAKAAPNMTGDISVMIELLVATRTEALQRQVAELEDKLAKIRSAIK